MEGWRLWGGDETRSGRGGWRVVDDVGVEMLLFGCARDRMLYT